MRPNLCLLRYKSLRDFVDTDMDPVKSMQILVLSRFRVFTDTSHIGAKFSGI